MRRLNKGRVALKHHGSLPSKLDLESFRSSTTAFLSDNTPLVFGTSFDNVSLVDFIQPEMAREKLKLAEQQVLDGDMDAAAGEVAVAFELIIDHYEDNKRDRSRRSPLFSGRDLTFNTSFSMGLSKESREDRKMAEFVDKVK